MWVQLILQYFILIAEILCLKLFVFNKYQLLLEYKMNDAAATGDETCYNEIPQWMQIMMYHGIDGRNIKRSVKEKKNCPDKLLNIHVTIKESKIFVPVILMEA